MSFSKIYIIILPPSKRKKGGKKERKKERKGGGRGRKDIVAARLAIISATPWTGNIFFRVALGHVEGPDMNG